MPPFTPTPPPGCAIDALGRALQFDTPPSRIVSLVPSLTEALFSFGLREEVVGVTTYCVEPAGLVAAVPKIGGTKNPDLEAINSLRPDLVIASAEENVREHVETLIDAGLNVYISLPTTVPRALDELDDLARIVHRPTAAEPFTSAARTLLVERDQRQPVPATSYFCPIWRRPWMTAGPDTYMTDLLARCGGRNIFDAGPARYYPVELAAALDLDPDIVLLPSEPYPFADKHVREIHAFAETRVVRAGRVHLIDGQLLTWYGPRIPAALRTFSALLASSVPT